MFDVRTVAAIALVLLKGAPLIAAYFYPRDTLGR
jgi:hypothetical protein